MRLVWCSAACQNWESMFASHIGIWSLGIWRFVVPVSLRAVNDCTNTNMNRQMNRGSLNIARDLFEVEILIHWRYTPLSDLHSAAPTSNGVHQPIGYDSMRAITSQSPRCAETIQQCSTVGVVVSMDVGRRVQSPRFVPPFQLRPLRPFEMLSFSGRT
jgi:hypothetical protein